MPFQPFLGEIMMFAGNFPPRGWAFCNGQILDIRQNTALFSLLGTTYGGDGRTTFGLPDLRGRVPVQFGNQPGGPTRELGESRGEENVTLSLAEVPAHTHAWPVSSGSAGLEKGPGPFAVTPAITPVAYGSPSNLAPMAAGTITFAGSGLPHPNMMPYLGMNFVIAIQGIFPARG